MSRRHRTASIAVIARTYASSREMLRSISIVAREAPLCGMEVVEVAADPRRVVRPGQLRLVPEGMLMEHGATDDGDMTALFITNKPFDIRYAFEDEQDDSSG